MAKFIYFFIRLFSLLPMRVLYIASDFLAFILYYVIKYRRKVTFNNLSNAFPQMDKAQIHDIEKKFYHVLADNFLETIKLASISKKEMQQRMRFENIEEVNSDLKAGHCVSLFLAHYGNWEWVSSMPLHLWEGAHPCQIYHHLHSKTAAYIFKKLRTRFGATNIPMEETLNVIGKDWKNGTPNICGYIADQSPKYVSLHHFTDFLGQQTAVITGTERISRLVHAPVYYCEMRRLKRGQYVCKFVKMTDDASALPKFELTNRYWVLLEKQIKEHPHLWLWSHKRWKNTLKRFKEIYPNDWEKRLNRL